MSIVKRLVVNYKVLKHFKRSNHNISYVHNVGKQPLKPMTLGQVLEETSQKYGDREAIISCYENKRLTYKELITLADKMAAGLRKLGLKQGDRVGIWMPNGIEWYITFMACSRIGLVTVGMNPAYQPRETEYFINKVGIKTIVTGHKFRSQSYYEILHMIVPELEKCDGRNLKSVKVPSLENIIIASDVSYKGLLNFNEVLEMSNISEVNQISLDQTKIPMDEPFNIQLTSGTTGLPKAAVISHFTLVNNGFLVGKRNEFYKKHHKVCILAPFFHAFGTVTISASCNHGATLVVPSINYNPDKSLDAIRDEKCSVIIGTPTMYVDLVNKQIQRKEEIEPEIAITGGASCSPKLFMDMLKHLNTKKVKSIFGLSETTAAIFQSLENDDAHKSISTVGYVSEHTEVKVVDEQNIIVPRGTPGELYVRGYFTMLGYYNDEGKSKEIIGSDKWLKTGDRFVLDEDGYGKVIGRLKEMIIRGGENIFPKEIEDYLNTHPEILETHVIGLSHERLGEEVCACVRVKDGSKLTVEDLREFCTGNISYYKIPSKLKIFDSFPKTGSGKIQKFKLIELLKQKTTIN